jgi:hypothetical protein
MAIWNILWILGIFYDYLAHFVFIWYIFSGFGIMYQEKSGNPALAAWSDGIVSSSGVMSREIESRQGVGLKNLDRLRDKIVSRYPERKFRNYFFGL